MNSQKLIWFYLLEKYLLSTIICVPNFAVSNYHKVITDIFFFVLYCFVPFLKFVPLPSENPRCASAMVLKVVQSAFLKTGFVKNIYDLVYLLQMYITMLKFQAVNSGFLPSTAASCCDNLFQKHLQCFEILIGV